MICTGGRWLRWAAAVARAQPGSCIQRSHGSFSSYSEKGIDPSCNRSCTCLGIAEVVTAAVAEAASWIAEVATATVAEAARAQPGSRSQGSSYTFSIGSDLL